MRKDYGALVVGAGVSGIRAALDLAVTGQKVALIDQRPNIGGILAQLDHQFPTDHCGMCKMLPLTERDASSQFCLRKGVFHRNIDLLLSTELTSLSGEPGQFLASLRKHADFVDPSRCIGCGLCATVCPVRVKDEFNAGLTERAAIFLGVPHNIPNTYRVDLDACQRCWQCYEACPTKAIDFKLKERANFEFLLVHENDEEAGELGGWLGELGFSVSRLKNAAEAVDRLGAGQPVGALLLDAALPEAERVLSRGLELHPHLAVVVLCSPENRELADELVAKGARDVLERPLKHKKTVAWLDKLFMRLVSDDIYELSVGAVILAGGFECFDPASEPQAMTDALLYGQHPGVLTALQFERLLSGTGLDGGGTRGELRRPDGKPMRKVAWLQCVGSRDLKKNADFCSSICCMFSIKEAVLAKKATDGNIDAAIFYMDLRTFGLDYEQYKNEARDTHGVRFIRARLHSVTPEPKGDGLVLSWIDDAGTMQQETCDALVLATGARPPKNMERLAAVAGVERNAWGFCETRPLAPTKTSVHGVMAAGAFAEPRDIAESLIHASAAALEASRLINLYAPIRERSPEPEPEYRDVSREPPKVLAVLCASCPILEQKIDVAEVRAALRSMAAIQDVEIIGRACTAEGWEKIKAISEERGPNRLLIGACMPYAYAPKLRELGRTIGLNPALMDVVDIYTTVTSAPAGQSGGELTARVLSSLRMGVAKLLGQDPSPLPPALEVSREALVVGGGLAGMTAALGIADHGYDVRLVEENEELGGQAMRLSSTLWGEDPRKYMQDLVEQVEKHPHIKVHKDARVTLSTGRAGRFLSLISTDEGSAPFQHGVTVLATGGHEANVYDYGFRVHKSVMTQRALEERLASGALDLADLDAVAMIQCWRSRGEGEEDRNYCSRVCCSQTMKNILLLKKRRPDLPIYVFYRDIMTYGFLETYYTQARSTGAVFIRYDSDRRPNIRFEDGKPVISAYEPNLCRNIELRADLLVLASGIEPNDVSEMHEIFGVDIRRDGFFQQAETKWRPVDFLKQGVYMCGLARGPANMPESIAQAKAAAERSLRILSEKRLSASRNVAEVRHTLCSLCGRCIEVCPYGARQLDPIRSRIIVDELLCQGCGSCAAICPNSASVLRGFTDQSMLSVIDAALENLIPTKETT